MRATSTTRARPFSHTWTARERRPLAPVLAAISAGIVADGYLPVAIEGWWAGAVTALMAWWLLRRSRKDGIAQASLLLAAGAAAALWHHGCWNLFGNDEIGRYATAQSRPVCIEAVTLRLARRVPAPPPDAMRVIPAAPSSRVELDITAIRDGNRWRPCSGRATLLVDGDLADVPVGASLRIYGLLSRPRPAHNPGEFDFAAHARGRRILARIAAPRPECVERLDPAGIWSITAAFEAARRRGHDLLWRHIDPSQAGLASAVLLGEREYVDRDETAAYLETGTIHLLSISGMHLAIVAGALFVLLRLGIVPRRVGLISIALIVLLYARLTDAEAPIVRAALMVVVFCVAGLLGRRAIGWNSLAAAAILVLATNPAELFRVGTQLSFLCMAVLVAVDARGWLRSSPDALQRLLRQSQPPLVRGLRVLGRRTLQAMLLSALVWLVTLPLAAARFHIAAPIGIVLNPIASLPMTLAMLSGFLVLVVGGFVPWLGGFFGGICRWSLAALEGIVEYARDLPVACIWTPGPDDWWLAGFFLMLALGMAFPRALACRHRVALAAVWLAAGLAVATWRAQPSGDLEVTFLSVGHGCAILIELPDGRNVLYDAGHMGSPDVGGRSIAAALWSKGITRLDALIISHADADHYNAVPYLVERFAVAQAFVSPVMFQAAGGLSPAVEALERSLHSAGIPIANISHGDSLLVGERVTMRVMHPPATGVSGSDNANSIVLAVEFAGRRILLTGDIEGPGLRRLVGQPPYDCDVLLAPHHGSLASSPREFAGWATPQWVIVSGGFRGDLLRLETIYGLVSARPLHTAATGAITAEIAANGELTVSRFLPP